MYTAYNEDVASVAVTLPCNRTDDTAATRCDGLNAGFIRVTGNVGRDRLGDSQYAYTVVVCEYYEDGIANREGVSYDRRVARFDNADDARDYLVRKLKALYPNAEFSESVA